MNANYKIRTSKNPKIRKSSKILFEKIFPLPHTKDRRAGNFRKLLNVVSKIRSQFLPKNPFRAHSPWNPSTRNGSVMEIFETIDIVLNSVSE